MVAHRVHASCPACKGRVPPPQCTLSAAALQPHAPSTYVEQARQVAWGSDVGTWLTPSRAAGMTPDLYLAISFRAEKKRALQDGLRSITSTIKVCGTLSSCCHEQQMHQLFFPAPNLPCCVKLCQKSPWQCCACCQQSLATGPEGLPMAARQLLWLCTCLSKCRAHASSRQRAVTSASLQALMDLKDPNPLKNMR